MLTDVRSSCEVVGSPSSSPLASVCTTMPGITHAEAAAGSSIAAAVAADAPSLFGAFDFRKEADFEAAVAVTFCVRTVRSPRVTGIIASVNAPITRQSESARLALEWKMIETKRAYAGFNIYLSPSFRGRRYQSMRLCTSELRNSNEQKSQADCSTWLPSFFVTSS